MSLSQGVNDAKSADGMYPRGDITWASVAVEPSPGSSASSASIRLSRSSFGCCGLSACRLGMPTVRPTACRPSATSSRSRSWAAIWIGVAAAEQLGQVDLQPADGADRGAGDGRRLVVGEHDGVLGTDPAARRTALLAVVLVLDQDAVELVHAVDAEQAEIDALHAVGAAAVVDHRIPAPLRLLQQLLRRETRRPRRRRLPRRR